MSPTPRTALLLGLTSVAIVAVPIWTVVVLGIVLLAAAAADAWSVRRAPAITRRLPSLVVRGVPAVLDVDVDDAVTRRMLVVQTSTADLVVEPRDGDVSGGARLVALRRGRHRLPPLAVRSDGPLGLGRWFHTVGATDELAVYPDVAAAQAIASAVRRGRFREPGRAARGPLGLGVDFESIRDYLPDDDLRQVNWKATSRLGRPMSNTYRVERDRDVVVLLDTGRLMRAPASNGTRLDVAMDALTAVALVADALQDRCGAVAFDASIRVRVAPRRRGGSQVLRSVFDLQPADVDADYRLAFQAVGGTKRAFVLILTDLLDEAAARSLLEAVPVLVRRHAVTVASMRDEEVGRIAATMPTQPADVARVVVAADMLRARTDVAARLRAAGAEVVEAGERALPSACVGAYLRAKAAARV